MDKFILETWISNMNYRIWTMKHYGKAEKRRSQVIHYMQLRRLLNCPNKLGTIIELYSSSGTSTSSQKKKSSVNLNPDLIPLIETRPLHIGYFDEILLDTSCVL